MTKAAAIRRKLAAQVRAESLRPTFSLPTFEFRIKQLEQSHEDMGLAVAELERRLDLMNKRFAARKTTD